MCPRVPSGGSGNGMGGRGGGRVDGRQRAEEVCDIHERGFLTCGSTSQPRNGGRLERKLKAVQAERGGTRCVYTYWKMEPRGRRLEIVGNRAKAADFLLFLAFRIHFPVDVKRTYSLQAENSLGKSTGEGKKNKIRGQKAGATAVVLQKGFPAALVRALRGGRCNGEVHEWRVCTWGGRI